MKIHSDILTAADCREAVRAVVADAPGVYLYSCESTGSRWRDHGLVVHLRGCGTRHVRRPGTVGAGEQDSYAATYDDWGYWIAELFSRDPAAIIGPYKGADDFVARLSAAYPVAA